MPAKEPDAARVPDLAALLQDIDALRTTLSTDLSLAAAALEAGADDVAEELVGGDLGEVRRFASRATGHLDALAAAEAPEAPPVVVPLARRRRLPVSAAPLVAAAAAVLGFAFGVVPERGGAPAAPELRMTSAAAASYELSRLAQSGASPEQLREAAEQLNDELAALIERADEDPAAAQQALLLLQSSEDLLGSRAGDAVLRGVLAEARALRQALRQAMPVRRPVVPAPSVPLVPLPELPVVQRYESAAPAEPQPDARPTAASPAPQPAEPSAAPAPQPTSTPAPEPTPERTPGPLIPDSDDSVPGL